MRADLERLLISDAELFTLTGFDRQKVLPSNQLTPKKIIFQRSLALSITAIAFVTFASIFLPALRTAGVIFLISLTLGGLSIAIKAYKLSLNGKEAPVMDGFTGIQRVFLGWGQVWQEKSRDEALRSQVANDPHSPALFRVNGVVRNVPEFYEAFNIKPTDKLYLAPDKRVKIW